MLDELIQSIANNNVILFVGAGVSKNLGAPTWSELIDYMGKDLGYDPQVFNARGASYLTLAEFYKLEKGSIGPLRSWMDKNWNVDEVVLGKSAVHRLITEIGFPIIYTTNYDGNIEESFRIYNKDYIKIVDVRDISRIKDKETQIIKFHGDFDSDESIVLTETDYFERLTFDYPLDVKLRSDALGKTILFIGYSLNDMNIRLLLHKIWKTWQVSGHAKHRPNSYVFLPTPDPIQEVVLRQWDVKVISEDSPEPGLALEAFLNRLLAALPKVAS
ncbi:Sir2 family NAD-dependent protein deacetylase [Rhizobium leguminosarum]|uniref:SIR2 family protein n=1 Tax=Rhizobium leguminosarum TaxID=384 RepID=UPI001C96981F|nr:SIR2 family protein [Rhizobium leguminosarum]MBY5601741.1 Sir2 family NAD-dependent protein deacetylase [Rhizobium leguminosarum]